MQPPAQNPRIPRRTRLMAALAAGVFALALSCAALASAGLVARHAKAGSILWGASIGSQLTGGVAPYDMKAVSKFQHVTGKGLSVVGWTAPFSVCTGSSCVP